MTALRLSERKFSICSLVNGLRPARRLRCAGLPSSAAIAIAERKSTARKRLSPVTILTDTLFRNMFLPPCFLFLYSVIRIFSVVRIRVSPGPQGEAIERYTEHWNTEEVDQDRQNRRSDQV